MVSQWGVAFEVIKKKKTLDLNIHMCIVTWDRLEVIYLVQIYNKWTNYVHYWLIDKKKMNYVNF